MYEFNWMNKPPMGFISNGYSSTCLHRVEKMGDGQLAQTVHNFILFLYNNAGHCFKVLKATTN